MSKLKGESADEYKKETDKYFRNVGTPKVPGMSADDAAVADRFLPSAEEEHRLLDRYGKGFSKTSRSGSFTDKPNASSAIFPNSLKFASEFIDENTPGKYKPQGEMKPPSEQESPVGWFPGASAVIEDTCLDCLKPVAKEEYVGGMYPISEQDTHKLASMGVKFSDIVLYVVHKSCWDYAKVMGKDKTPLALVFGGNVMSDKDIMLMQKYGKPMQIHDGQEKTLGQWYLQKRQESLWNNLCGILKAEKMKPTSKVFRVIDSE